MYKIVVEDTFYTTAEGTKERYYRYYVTKHKIVEHWEFVERFYCNTKEEARKLYEELNETN